MLNENKPFMGQSEVDIFPLQGKFQQPIRLYTHDDRPVTDREGFVLRNIIGKNLAEIDIENNNYQDIKGLNLVDALGRTVKDINFDPTVKPLYEISNEDPSQGIECHKLVYDINGNPLTDKFGRPLVSRNGKLYLVFGPRGDPVSDIAGRDVIDEFGKVVTRNKPLKDKNENILSMFDLDGRPLTDSDGFPLLDITGMKMIIFEENNPVSSLSGSDLFDADGIAQGEKDCDFTKRSRFVKSNITISTDTNEPAVAFDSHGYPLSDLLGNPLSFRNGTSMISYSSKKWIDFNGETTTILPRKVYDRFTLRGFKNSFGHPIRLFDDYGRPLTDVNGVPQRHASGLLMIKFDQSGAPISNWLNKPLYDANGQINGSSYFRPCLAVSKPNVVAKIQKGLARGVQYFESTGMPLTNALGYPLVNAREEPMIIFDKGGEPLHDFRKKVVYNALGLPAVSCLEFPLLGPGGIPIRLYDKEDRPLTDSTGLPLKDVRGRYMLRIYSKGMGIMDIKGREVYDKNGYSTKYLTHFNASGAASNIEKEDMVISVDGEPMFLYDEEGYPLTEQSGLVLSNRLGQSLIKSHEQGFSMTLDDKPVYDVKGRKCLKTFSRHLGLSIGLYDKNSRPLTDRYGSVLHTRKGKDLVIFDTCFRPVSALVGGELYDYKGMPLKHPFADPSRLAKNPAKQTPDGVQLFDCEDLPLTDASGFILYTSYGVPMVSFDVHGRIKCDHSGRPVFDIRGLAVSRSSGAWKDQCGKPYRLFNQSLPLTDEDGRELYDIKGKSLIHQDKIGRPVKTVQGSYVQDSKGRRFVDIHFKPIIMSNHVRKSPLLEEDKSALRLYDSDGNPLTDILGRPLVNSKGEFLINGKNGLHRLTDCKGKQIYDRFRMPLGCNPKSQIKVGEHYLVSITVPE
uniref:Uncharacterized protein n=1 Tax=Rhodnius prolixus TaxID=13249 RepID=T1HPU7_RHOPR